MTVDEKGQFIGTGEKLVRDIIEIIFSHGYVKPQVRLSSLIDISETWRQAKESVDLAVWQNGDPEKTKPDFVVRIQNEKGGTKMNHEDRQKRELEKAGIKVVDINWYECTEVFRERLNYLSFFEVCDALRRADVMP